MEKNFSVRFENTPFLTTSKTASHPNRLNWRCELLLTRNREAIENKRILDLASHDGRFSYACLALGASHVTGVEARPHLVESARSNLSALGCGPQSFRFVLSDVFDYLPTVQPAEFDTILCFGFLYHTVRQVEFIREIKRMRPRWLILDTDVQKLLPWESPMLNFINALRSPFGTPKRAHLVFKSENASREGATIDSSGLVAYPTKGFIELLLEKCDFRFRELLWDKKEIRDWAFLDRYRRGRRVSYIAQPVR
jgi:2-polyprenyl-3-methyl-5-hydroxy-6-metoxy-1,4-benzoquinol methylase